MKEQIKINIEHYKDTFDKFPCKSHRIGLQYKIVKKWGNSLEITGEIKEIIYRNEINSYTIAVLETREEETTTVRVSSFYK